MTNMFDNIENIDELLETNSEVGKNNAQVEMLSENLELAKQEGNAEAIDFYEKKLSKFSVDDNLNENSDVMLGSSCEAFCQETHTDRTSGNYTSKGH